jgi:hypothetical protein
MIPYQTKTKKISGSNYGEVMRKAFVIFDLIKKKTKRRPYVRSAYFKKEKIFFDHFREHLFQKNSHDRERRMKFFAAAVELIEKSKNDPVLKTNPNKKGEIFYRFAGLTKEGHLFFVQIKENRNKQKYFMSCFGPE